MKKICMYGGMLITVTFGSVIFMSTYFLSKKIDNLRTDVQNLSYNDSAKEHLNKAHEILLNKDLDNATNN